MSANVYGDTSNLKASQARALEKFATRQLSPEQVVGPTLAKDLLTLSRELNRQLGLFVDRRGRVERVIVGDAHALQLPEFARVRGADGRLRGVRLLLTHLLPESLNREELADLAKLLAGLTLVAFLLANLFAVRTLRRELSISEMKSENCCSAWAGLAERGSRWLNCLISAVATRSSWTRCSPASFLPRRSVTQKVSQASP